MTEPRPAHAIASVNFLTVIPYFVIGMVRITCITADTAGLVETKISSGSRDQFFGSEAGAFGIFAREPVMLTWSLPCGLHQVNVLARPENCFKIS